MVDIINAQQPDGAILGDYAWRVGARTAGEARRSLNQEVETMLTARVDGTHIPNQGQWQCLERPMPVAPRDPSLSGGAVIMFG